MLNIIEHKSSPEKNSLLQVIGYFLATYEEDMQKNKKLKPIIPIILYRGKYRWNLPENFRDYFNAPPEFMEYILQFKYVLIDLSKYENKELLKRLDRNVRLIQTVMH